MKLTDLAKAALLLTLTAVALGMGAIRLSGQSLLVITGSSMEPTIHKGAVVLVQPVAPDDVRVGDVTTFSLRGETVTHRVIAAETSADGRVFVTKGDANAVPDPEPKIFADRVGLVRRSIPLVGYAVVSLQAYGRVAMLGLSLVTLLASIAGVVRRTVAARAVSPQLRRLRLYCTTQPRRGPSSRARAA